MEEAVERTDARPAAASASEQDELAVLSPSTSANTLVAETPDADSPPGFDPEKTLQDASQRLAGLSLDAIKPEEARKNNEDATTTKTVKPQAETELERLKRQLREEQHLRERAEARATEAEQREHRLTVQELRDHIDRLLLVGLSRYTGEQDPPLPMGTGRMPDIQPSSHLEPPSTAKPSRKKKIIPTELAFDSTMQTEVAALGSLLDAPAIRARRTTIPEGLVTTLSSQFTRQRLRIERDFEDCWKGLVLLLVGAILEQLASIVVEHTRAQHDPHDATALASIAEQLAHLYPHIPWHELGDDNLCWTHCIPSTLNHSAPSSSRSEAQGSRSTTTSAGKRLATKPLAPPGSGSTHSDRPPWQYGRIISDIFASLKLDGIHLYHVTEIKAYNAHNSQSVESNFRRHTTTSHVAHEPSAYSDFDLLEAVRSETIDVETLHVIKQCFTYIRGHACPFVHLNVGLTHVFFRYDHQHRKRTVQARAANQASLPPVQLHYYIVSKYPPSAPAKEHKSEATDEEAGDQGWRQKHALLDAVLASLLKGLDDRFATDEEQRSWWTADLDQHAYEAVEPTSLSMRRTADAASSAGDANHRPADDDEEDDRAGDGGARGGGGGGEGGGKGQGGKPAGGGGGAGKQDGGEGKTHRPADGAGQLVATPTRKVLGELDPNIVRPLRPSAGPGSPRQAPLSLGPRHKQLSNLKPKLPPTVLTPKLHAPVHIDLQPFTAALTAGGAIASAVPSDESEFEWDGTPRYARRYKGLITRHWCTPACLAGLKHGLAMDASCPNASLHCLVPGCRDHASHKHAYGLEQIRTEMLEAIVSTEGPQRVKRAMEPILGCSGVRAQLFRYVHATLGYAFAAKGVHVYYTDLLEKETAMLEHIWHQTTQMTAQATAQATTQAVEQAGGRSEVGNKDGFPVLGEFRYGGRGVRVHVPLACGVVERDSFDFAYPIYPGDAQLGGTEDQIYSAWMLLSYHALSLLRTRSRRALAKRLRVHGRDETTRMLMQLRRWCRTRLGELGIQHDDVHEGNLLWCPHLEAVVVIDFERAEWSNTSVNAV